jgi:glycogen debranching enzyme
MKKNGLSTRLTAAALSAALLLSSFGPAAAAAAAQEFAARPAAAPIAGGAIPVLPSAAASFAPALTAAPMSAPSAAAPAAVPLAAPAVAAVTLSPAALAPAKAAPAVPAPSPARAASLAPAAAAAVSAFAARVAAPLAELRTDSAAHLSRVYDDASAAGAGDSASAPESAVAAFDGPSGLARPSARVAAAALAAEPVPPRAEREERSARFPLGMALAAGGVWAVAKAVGWSAIKFTTASAPLSVPHAALAAVIGAAGGAALIAAGVFALNAVVDAVAFASAMRAGKNISDAEFRAFVRKEVAAGRLDGNAASLLKPYRPQGRFPDMTFAFAARGSIWIRPELAASPRIFRLVMVHELQHLKSSSTRGPPRAGIRGLVAGLLSEGRARAAELGGSGGLKDLKVPALERAMRQAQISLKLSRPYEILVVNPDTKELADPALYAGLSNGAATVTSLAGAEPAQALGEAAGKDYQAVVLGRPAGLLPDPSSAESRRLEGALEQMDSLYVLATRLVPRSASFTPGSADARAYADLTDKADRLRAAGSPVKAMAAFENDVRRLWRQIAATKLKDVGVNGLVGGMYGGLRDRGTAFLSFAPEDRGVVTWERLLRYWEAADGGKFRVTRVDLEDGGHILMLRKIEARVGLWLRPIGGGRIEDSVPRADESDAGRAAARAALTAAGYAEQMKLFDSLDVSVRHVFGADTGRQELYITVPRRNATAIRKFVTARSENAVGASKTDFEPHLMDSAALHDVPPVWQAGVTGEGGRIMWIDTGADATHEDFAGRLDVIDMVNEGPEDWAGHGTHVAGISISGGAGFLGMAKGARGTMAKVFSREGQGASDGEIMGSATIAMQKGYDVISLSLGSRGGSADNLADFFSQLTHQKNAAGDYPIVSASAGNSGPFDKTLSQPAAGVDVLAVAAAAKSLDDGKPEIAFYSSVGPDIDRRFTVKRWRLKPEITGIGGDVTTPPGSSNVYEFGVYSAKSKDSARSSSDLPDGRHTGMSGTSMSNPAVAAIALLIKLGLKLIGAKDDFVSENLPFVVKAVLMRSAKDLEAPIWFQGAGLVDAWAAVKLTGAAAGRGLGAGLKRLVGAAAGTPGEGWDWAVRLKAVADAEDRVFAEAAAPKTPAAAEPESEGERRAAGSEEEPHEDVEAPNAMSAGNADAADSAKRFAAARERETPALIAALKDPVWLVRQRAAFALMNLRAPAAGAALAAAAVGDADARVRQMAFLALAETRSAGTDAALKAAVSDPRWDVGVYAAYALARRGDRSGAARIVSELSSVDKRARFASAWLAGQLGVSATAAEAEALSARVKDPAERGNIRHLATASLKNLAAATPEALTDRVVTDVLDAAGPDNIALTRTIGKFFPEALNDHKFVARLRAEPLKTAVTAFVLRNKPALQKPGALAELVTLLARAANIPLDAPTSAPDPTGAGVQGVDAALGQVDLILTPPSGAPAAYADGSDAAALSRAFAAAGLDAAALSRFESTPRAALPVSGSLWLSVPEHKLYALVMALQTRGFGVRTALPEYPLARGAAAGAGAVLDLGDGQSPAVLAPDADLSLVRVRAAAGVSEARVMAALERVAERARGRGPTVISLALGAPTGRRTPLSALIDGLVARGVGVVVGAGNAGPSAGTVASPGDAKLAVVVAAASREGLQFYSARGTPEDPRVSWTDLVDHLDAASPLADAAAAVARAALGGTEASASAVSAVGTAAAAERTAEKLSRLARTLADAFAAKGRAMPSGWFPFLAEVVASAATPMPGRAAHEVGAGLFDDEDRARAALASRLGDLDEVQRRAGELTERARETIAPPSPAAPSVGLTTRVLRAAASAALAFLPARAPAEALTLAAVASVERLTAPAPAGIAPGPGWWKDASATRAAVSVPLYALRRASEDPGIGKFTDLGRHYKDVLAPQGVDAVLLLPHFATLDGSPYAPVSLNALSEDNVDWSEVDEVRGRPDLRQRLEAPDQASRASVDRAALRAREGAVAREALAAFTREQLAKNTPRAAEYRDFLRRSAGWLDEYGEFMALSELIGKPVLEWTPQAEAAARRDPSFAERVNVRRFVQWNAERQLRAALDQVHAAGGRVLFDVPMFRAKNSVDAWKRPERFADLRTRNPGIVNAWVHEDWKDLALWRWSAVKADGYKAVLEPFERWLAFGFDGARADALHFAYNFGNGQMASGDEPGDEYAAALAAVLAKHGGLPLAEAFEGKDQNARRLGFVTVGGDWKKVSSHDDPRSPDFMGRYFGALNEGSSGANAKFVAYTLGDEWRDPFPVKEMRDGRSYWNYRIPLPSDPDYENRARFDARPQLKVMKALKDGNEWSDPAAARALLGEAADSFVKHEGGSVQIWAASMDWFLEEWGRDTFVSLPGLLLSTGRYEEAKENIRRFAKFEHEGLIPNKIWDASRWTPEKADGADYNTADAPMWFVSAVQKTVAATGDWNFAREMAPVMRRILARYQSGTGYQRYGRFNKIFMDADGLIVTPAQATWMDADPDGKDQPVTPRNGKAVEINALWYANLRFMADVERRFGATEDADRDDGLAAKVKASFNEKFWFKTEDNARAWGGDGGSLRDVVEGDPHGDAVRPNMIFAVSHGGDLLSLERRRAVVLAVTRDLLTRYGLRTLSPRDSFYRERYDTSKPAIEKDQAYHQGTVWPWLMGAYAEALAGVRLDQGWDEQRVRAEQRVLMTPLLAALVARPEGSLPEVFDGGKPDAALASWTLENPNGLAGVFDAPADQNRGGTRSQAWSVAEVLRTLIERGLVPAGYDGAR